MNKSLLVVLISLFVLSASAHSIDEVMKAYKNDKCIAGELETIKPRISAKVAELKEVRPILFRTRRTSSPKLS